MPAFQPNTISSATRDGHGISIDPVSNSNGLSVYAGRRFKPDPNDQYAQVYVNEGVTALQPIFTLSLQRPSKTSRIAKSRMKLVVPEPVLDGGKPTTAKSHENSIDIIFMSSEKSTEEERALVFENFLDALNKPDFREVFLGNKAMY